MFWILYLGSQRGFLGTWLRHAQAERRSDGRPRRGKSLVISPVGPEAASVGQLAYQALRKAILAMDIYQPGTRTCGWTSSASRTRWA